MSDQTQPAQTRLTDDQVVRMALAIQDLKATSVIAEVIARSLDQQTDLDGKRRVLVTAFAQTYELLLIMNMAVESKVGPSEFEAKLKEVRARNHGATPG